MTYDIIIVGAGPAGMMAAIYAKRADKSILLLDKFGPGGRVRGTFEIDNYLGFGKVDAQELVQKMTDHLHDLDIDVEVAYVEKIVPEGNEFVLHSEELTYHCKAVILATGTSPKPLGVKGEAEFLSRGVSYCAVCDGLFFENKDVVMIGGGDSAVEESLVLAKWCKHVTIIHECDALNASKSLIDKIQSKGNVDVLLDQEVLSFVGTTLLEAVELKDKKTNLTRLYPTQGAFVYCGNQAATAFVKDLFHKEHMDHIKVNSAMETKVPGVFACGDVTKTDYRYIVTAISDGAIAAITAVRYLDSKKSEG